MTVQTFNAQTMLVAIGFGSGLIIATESDIIKHEIGAGSPLVEDHIRTIPEEPGNYVWSGDVTITEVPGTRGVAIDGETTWAGTFRRASVSDLHGFGVLVAPGAKSPDAVLTCDVPFLRLKCYHLAVQDMGAGPFDAVLNHSGHNSFELVDPEAGASAMLQEWANEETADGDRTLRHLVIEDRTGECRFIAQRRGQVSMYTTGTIRFDAYTDYAGVLPNPGVVEMLMENPCLGIDMGPTYAAREGGVA